MEINNNNIMPSNENSEDDVAYYSLFDNYSIWTLETVEEQPTYTRSNSQGPASSTAGSYVSQITKNAEQLVHSTVDVPVHKKRNLIRTLEGMIEDLQQKVARLQEEVEGQDFASTFLGVKPTSSRSETGSCRCTSSAQLLVLQNKFQQLEQEKDHLHQEMSRMIDNNTTDNCSGGTNKKLEAENRMLQEKLKISMEKLGQVTKDLMKQSCNPNTITSKSSNSNLKFLLQSKSKDLKLELQDISDNQILIKNEFYELYENTNFYLQQCISALSKLQCQKFLSTTLQTSQSSDSLHISNHIDSNSETVAVSALNPNDHDVSERSADLINQNHSNLASSQKSSKKESEQNHASPVQKDKDSAARHLQTIDSRIVNDSSKKIVQKSSLANGPHSSTIAQVLNTPPKSLKSSRQDTSSSGNSPRKNFAAKLKQRSNSLQNDKTNLSLFGRSISITDVDGEAARSDVVAGSDVGVCYLDILQSVIRSSESPSASLDVITHQKNNGKGCVRIMCRVRPLQTNDGPEVLQLHERECFVVVQHKNRTKVFDVDQLLGEQSTQEDVHISLKENALAVLRGGRNSIFSYGNTGAGKTYTMQGTPIEGGLIKRLLEDLLEHKDNQSFILVSAVECRNDTFRDIFDQDTKRRLEAKTSSDGSLQLISLSELPIHSDTDLNKAVRKFQMSRQSQISQLTHLIVQIKINNRIGDQEMEIGKLSLIELACSERIEKSAVLEASRWKEVQWVAKSLTSLDEVLQAIVANKPHVPYRASKLTHFLQDCLSVEESNIDVIVQIGPGEKFAAETTASLMLAQRLRNNDSVLRNVALSTKISGKTSPLPEELVTKPRRPSIGSRSVGSERRSSLTNEKMAAYIKKEPTVVYKNATKF